MRLSPFLEYTQDQYILRRSCTVYNFVIVKNCSKFVLWFFPSPKRVFHGVLHFCIYFLVHVLFTYMGTIHVYGTIHMYGYYSSEVNKHY